MKLFSFSDKIALKNCFSIVCLKEKLPVVCFGKYCNHSLHRLRLSIEDKFNFSSMDPWDINFRLTDLTDNFTLVKILSF